MLYQLVCEEFENNDFPILHDDKKYISLRNLTSIGQKFVSGIQKSIIKEAGLDFVYNVLFELKFKPTAKVDNKNDSEEGTPSEKEVNKP